MQSTHNRMTAPTVLPCLRMESVARGKKATASEIHLYWTPLDIAGRDNPRTAKETPPCSITKSAAHRKTVRNAQMHTARTATFTTRRRIRAEPRNRMTASAILLCSRTESVRAPRGDEECRTYFSGENRVIFDNQCRGPTNDQECMQYLEKPVHTIYELSPGIKRACTSPHIISSMGKDVVDPVQECASRCQNRTGTLTFGNWDQFKNVKITGFLLSNLKSIVCVTPKSVRANREAHVYIHHTC